MYLGYHWWLQNVSQARHARTTLPGAGEGKVAGSCCIVWICSTYFKIATPTWVPKRRQVSFVLCRHAKTRIVSGCSWPLRRGWCLNHTIRLTKRSDIHHQSLCNRSPSHPWTSWILLNLCLTSSPLWLFSLKSLQGRDRPSATLQVHEAYTPNASKIIQMNPNLLYSCGHRLRTSFGKRLEKFSAGRTVLSIRLEHMHLEQTEDT